MEPIRKTSESKYNLHIATNNSQTQCNKEMQNPSVSSFISSFHGTEITHNCKRPNSFPSSSTKDIRVPAVRTKSLSRLISQIETSLSDSKNVDNLKISGRMYRDDVRKIILPLPQANNGSTVTISTDPKSPPFSKAKSQSWQSGVSPRLKENTPTNFINKDTHLLAAQNFVNDSPYEEPRVEVKSCIFATDKKTRDIRVLREHHYEEIDEIDSPKCSEINDFKINSRNPSVDEVRQRFDENRTVFSEDGELASPVNQRCRGSQGSFSYSDNEKSKVKTEECNIENDEDEIWKNYTDRPLLPLKPLQKQKSMSCVNLVQTIKGFSKKKSSTGRQSSPINNIKSILFPENTLIQKKEMYTSEANISEIRTELVASEDLTVRRMTDSDIATKSTRQSLLPNYTWFHPIDAKEASKRLLKMQQNGAFLIRPASNPTSEVLHTLCVVSSRRVYNFHVKSLKSGRITLGKRKGQEETFSSLLDMIKYHQFVPISINSMDSNEVSQVYLLITPPK